MTLWAERDEPVLRHLTESSPVHGVLFTESRSETPRKELQRVTEVQFHDAVQVLEDAGYVTWGHSEGDGAGGRSYTHFQVTGAGKQVLGLWPAFDALGSPGQLAEVLDALAEDAATEEERSNLQRAGAAVRRSAPEAISALATGALTTLARTQLGI